MGTKQAISTVALVATDAAFRAWGLAHSNALTAAGWVKTADTGQIDWTSVTKPATVNTSGGYEIRVSADSPAIYLKISYGIGAATAATSACVHSVVIGTGSDGAGTITGTATLTPGASDTGAKFSNAQIAAVGSTGSYICAPAGTLVIVQNALCYGASPLAAGAVLVIDRTRDANGAATSEGATVYWVRYSTATVPFVQMGGLNFAVPGAVAFSPPVCAIPDATTWSTGGNFFAARMYGRLPGLCSSVMLAYLHGEIGAFTEFDVAPIGATSRHYLALGSSTAGNAGPNQTNNLGANVSATNEAIVSLAVIWEN